MDKSGFQEVCFMTAYRGSQVRHSSVPEVLAMSVGIVSLLLLVAKTFPPYRKIGIISTHTK